MPEQKDRSIGFVHDACPWIFVCIVTMLVCQVYSAHYTVAVLVHTPMFVSVCSTFLTQYCAVDMCAWAPLNDELRFVYCKPVVFMFPPVYTNFMSVHDIIMPLLEWIWCTAQHNVRTMVAHCSHAHLTVSSPLLLLLWSLFKTLNFSILNTNMYRMLCSGKFQLLYYNGGSASESHDDEFA